VTAAPFECTRCGACCFSTSDRYVSVTGDDYERLGATADSIAVFFENRCYLKMVDNRCAALRITERGSFFCLIYEVRPAVCRDLVPGSAACEAEQFRKAECAAKILRSESMIVDKSR
jgi:uncharacterized protein